MKLQAFSTLLDEVVDLPTYDADNILEIGEFMATGHDNLIVFVDKPPRLQKWEAE